LQLVAIKHVSLLKTSPLREDRLRRLVGIGLSHWDRLFGPKRPLLIFRGTLSGKTKQNKEKRKTKMQDYLIPMNPEHC
jgi:hypothetical protein